MTCSLVLYKNLPLDYKNLLSCEGELDPNRMIYLVKENGKVKTITTSVCAAIKKVQANKVK